MEWIYTPYMTKRLVDIADDKLAEARDILGQATIKGTINAALDEVIALNQRRRLLERLADQRGVDLGDEEIMREAWK